MKTLHMTITLLAGLLMPFSVSAADEGEVTIRMMQMHESSSDAFMNLIELPEATTEKDIHRSRDPVSHRNGQGKGKLENDRQQVREVEHTFEQQPHMEQFQEMQQEHHEFEQDRENQTPGNEQQGGNQNGPGPSGR